MTFKINSTSPKQTEDYAKKIAPLLESGDLISLNGDLGAGKTIFAKGLAKGLDIDEEVTSPTFTVIREYEGRLPLYHFDVYRLKEEDIDDLGYEDYFYAEGITLVEWGQKIKNKLPGDYLEIYFKYEKNEQSRTIGFKEYGNFANKLEKIKKILAT